MIYRKKVIAKALLSGGIILLCKGLYMDAKAIAAQSLIAFSWQQQVAASPPPKPWWWADTKAIAKLEFLHKNRRLFVMQDASGESLAFGPGHLINSAGISTSGHVMIAGHRDSHFDFLHEIEIGAAIKTTHFKAGTAHYKVSSIRILNTDTDDLVLGEASQLTLITCYPFKGFIPGGPLRYIVNAERVDL